MPETHSFVPARRIRRRIARPVAWLGAVLMAGALSGCAGGAPPSASAGRPSGGIEVFGTVDASVSHTR